MSGLAVIGAITLAFLIGGACGYAYAFSCIFGDD